MVVTLVGKGRVGKRNTAYCGISDGRHFNPTSSISHIIHKVSMYEYPAACVYSASSVTLLSLIGLYRFSAPVIGPFGVVLSSYDHG